MATSNFPRPNASYYYTFAMDCDDQDIFDMCYQDVINAVSREVFNPFAIVKRPQDTADNCFAAMITMIKSKDYPADDYLEEVQLRLVVKY